MNWFDFTIKVTLKKNNGSFGFKRERHEFRFCAQSRNDAISLALSNVPSRGWPYEEREFQVTDNVPADRAISDECRNAGCEDCNFLWCQCGHHSAVAFQLEHQQLQKLRSQSTIEERGAA